ncbi:hypothetical protein Dda_8996 [Drechslerella dactyloides]|uniref:Uncharacterized protein n=1 Tax=Drechslerella dactyloides TaxID=74499 RepID=A0AAD6IPZ1_DREDA|nr:hypothetical protein Dda_8996 [Drechslerella dactyloides]
MLLSDDASVSIYPISIMRVTVLSLYVLSAGVFAAAVPITNINFPGIPGVESASEDVAVAHIQYKRGASPQEPPIDMHPPAELEPTISAYANFWNRVAQTLNIDGFLDMYFPNTK